MNSQSLFSQFIRRTFAGNAQKRRRTQRPASNVTAAVVERVEERRLLSATNDLASLSDEFDADTTADWQRVNEVEGWNADQLQTYDINQSQDGRLVMAPHSVVWYQNWRGPMAFKEVTGDFVFTTQVHVTDRDDIGGSDGDDVPNDAQYSLGGAMIRTPRNINDPAVDWQPGSMQDDGTNNGENYVFLSLGHGTDGQMSFEVKTTRNSNSQLYLTPANSNTALLQVARIGNTVLMMRQLPGEDWVVHERYSRPDMSETVQVGLVSYTDWEKASDYDPFYHNSNVLPEADQNPTPTEPFNPDLIAGYEYARYVRPQIPAELDGIDLLNAATDEQLLSFLGENANIPAGVDPPEDLPIVSVEAADALIAESTGSATTFNISRAANNTDDALSVSYSVAGSAQSAVDYSALSGTAIIPAGANSVAIDVAVIGDAAVEGAETVELHLVDSVFYELGNLTATVTIADDDFETIGDQTIAADQSELTLSLPATHPDGAVLTYGASLVGEAQYALDQQYDFYVQDSYHENWGGLNERWIRGNESDWFYLLPTGSLNHWQGSLESSAYIATLESSIYDDPTLLVDVGLVATVSVTGNELTLLPNVGFAGSFEVDISISSVHAESTERITVTVEALVNEAPVILSIEDQTMSHADGELRIPFVATDADGDALMFSASVVQSMEFQLDQQYEFASAGDYYENWGGHNERWITANIGGNHWFYLLPNGTLNRWEGSFEDSVVVSSLTPVVYDDPTLLINAEAVLASVAIDGSDIVVAPESDFVGEIQVRIEASDGLAVSATDFSAFVTNTAPVLGPIGDLVITATDGTIDVELVATDADGDVLTWTAEVVNSDVWNLDADLDLQTSDNFHTNWGGQNEKWLQSGSGSWFFILSNGEFRRWTGSFETSELVATLDAAYYDDPNQIADPHSVPVTASISGTTLTLDADETFSGSFQVRVEVFDGFESVSQLINVSVGI